MPTRTPITVAHGDGIGPEIMAATLHILEADGAPETFCTDSYRCRFISKTGTTPKEIVALLGRVSDLGFDIAMTDTLRTYAGKLGFTLAQGQ